MTFESHLSAMRYICALVTTLLLVVCAGPSQAQITGERQATMMVVGTTIVSPEIASSAYSAGFEIAGRGEVLESEGVAPTVYFGFGRRPIAGNYRYDATIRAGGQWREGRLVVGGEAGLSNQYFSSAADPRYKFQVATHGGIQAGALQLGIGVSSTFEEDPEVALSAFAGVSL